ncbi:MAG: M12 family metallo-peptidase [Ginsengibacter sp.]
MIHNKLAALIIVSLFIASGCNKKDIVTNLAPIQSENNKITGASANELLASSKYTSLKIEIQYMPGFPPDANALNNTMAFLNSLINKPAGIVVTQTQINSSGKSSIDINDIASIEQNNRTTFSSGNQISVYILFADAGYSDPKVLGVAYRNTSLCLFAKIINNNSGAIGQVSRTKLETAVLEHEIGHILGLVDIGSPMQTNHKDGAHGNHCNNTNCLMYYTSETTDLLGFLVTGNIPVLDANCINDLHFNGSK